MKEEQYWNTFLTTGKVEDYLKSKHSFSEKGELEYDGEKVGDESHAGTSDHNRDDLKDSTYGRI